MQIGIDIRCLMQPNYSGVAEYTFNLLKNIFDIDHRNQYLLFYNARQNVASNLPQFNYPNVKFAGFNYPNKLFNLSLRALKYPKIDKLLGDVDVFFMPNLNFASCSKKSRKIMTVHDLSFEISPHFFSKKRSLWHKIINPRRLISDCDKIIAVSQNTKNDLINLYAVPEAKIKVIYSGVDSQFYRKLDKTSPDFKQIKQKFQLPKNFIFFLGTLEPRKNVESIIEAFDILKNNHPDLENLNLIITGEKGWHYQDIFCLINKSPWQKQIKCLGYVSAEEKVCLYNSAELFVFPSYYEGFGLPVLEAQACGLPVIAGLNSSFPEILGDSALLTAPDNLTELSQAIYRILSETEFKQNMINKGFKNVQSFSWEKTAQKTLEIFTL